MTVRDHEAGVLRQLRPRHAPVRPRAPLLQLRPRHAHRHEVRHCCWHDIRGKNGNLEGPPLILSINVSIVGFAFVYFEDERDGEDAIRRLDNVSFGYSRRRLSVEWSRQVEPVSRSNDMPSGDVKPTRTLFVINFDPFCTQIQDIERHFEPYGKITNIRIRKNFAFVRYETVEEASAAVKKTDKSTILDRVLTVEYAFRDDDNGGIHDKRRDSPYVRSPSPRYRRDYSPDYDRHARNPGYVRRDGASYDRRSPVYDLYDRDRSPVYDRYNSGRSPVYDRYNRDRGPAYGRYDRRRSPGYDQY